MFGPRSSAPSVSVLLGRVEGLAQTCGIGADMSCRHAGRPGDPRVALGRTPNHHASHHIGFHRYRDMMLIKPFGTSEDSLSDGGERKVTSWLHLI